MTEFKYKIGDELKYNTTAKFSYTYEVTGYSPLNKNYILKYNDNDEMLECIMSKEYVENYYHLLKRYIVIRNDEKFSKFWCLDNVVYYSTREALQAIENRSQHLKEYNYYIMEINE